MNAFSNRDFQTSAFKHLYKPMAHELRLEQQGSTDTSESMALGMVRKFLEARADPARRPWEAADIEKAITEIRKRVLNAANRLRLPPGDLTLKDWASFIWTTANPILPADGKLREFYVLMNECIREDDAKSLGGLLPFIVALNSVLVSRDDRDMAWPISSETNLPLRESYRGTGIPAERIPWFQKGRAFRVPWPLATGEMRKTAQWFAGESTRAGDKVPVVFVVTFPPEVDHPSACFHVALLTRSVTRAESELLFVAYSKFEVMNVEHRTGPPFNKPWYEITLQAYKDNLGEECLPLVEWM